MWRFSGYEASPRPRVHPSTCLHPSAAPPGAPSTHTPDESGAYPPGMTGGGWLDPSELRIGLGCMRLSTGECRDDDVAHQTVAAAARAGVTVFDTARAYGRGERELGHNERLVASALRSCGAAGVALIIT